MISRNLCFLTIPIFICTIFKHEATDEGSKTAAGVNEITYHNRIRKNAQFRITKNMVWIRNLHGIYMEFT
ncbi:hypothetical protein GLOIN_2v1739917 [Rhizophagus irregularis DAOM 181602=DAOM 197198]|nr:hypothetical protein GLOIN_2v1739917 [Rhizophagus irregularis DAOM 181602=DAOM 197198]